MIKKILLIYIFASVTSSSIWSQITYTEFADSISTWVNNRVENSKNGLVEKVEIPFVVRTLAWGCICPDNYMGVYPNTQEGPWIYPVYSKKLPSPNQNGYSFIATGYFTGTIKELDLRSNESDPEEWLYKVPEFKIISLRKNKNGEGTLAPKIISK